MNQIAAQPAPLSGHPAPASARPVEPEGAITNLRDASSQLEALLDDDGNSPDHDISARDQVDDDLGNGDDVDDDAAQPSAEDVVDDDDDASDTDDPDGDDDTADIDDDPDDDSDDSDDDGDGLTTLAELEEALEMDADSLKDLKVTFKAAGEEVTVPISEVIAGYQKDSDYRKQTAALAEERRDFTTTVKTQTDTYTQQSTVLAQVLTAFERNITAHLESPAMQELRRTDPAEWTAQREEAGQRLAQFNNLRTAASKDFDAFKAGAQKAFLTTQGQILARDVPDWGAEKRDIAVNVMKSYGFSDEEIPEIADARFIKAALAFDEVMKENEALKQKEKKGKKAATKVKATVPKTLKPGSKKGKGKGRRPNFEAAKKRMKANPIGKANTQAAADAIEQLLVRVED